MGRLIAIDGVSLAVAMVVWYFCFLRYNHKKAAASLRWVEAACSGRGRVVESRWIGCARLQAQLRFASHWFENAQVTVKLRPRPLPLNWFYSIYRKQRETLTFEADLDCAPNFRLEVFRHRWLTHKHDDRAGSRNWTITRPGPVVLTTRTEWTQELTPVVNTLMTSRGHSLLAVRFRPESPHLAATIPLDSLADEQSAAGFVGMLRELAAGASTSHQ